MGEELREKSVVLMVLGSLPEEYDSLVTREQEEFWSSKSKTATFKDKLTVKCFGCGGEGHFRKKCEKTGKTIQNCLQLLN